MAGVVLVLTCKVIKDSIAKVFTSEGDGNDASCTLLNTLDTPELCRSKFDSLDASVQIALINVLLPVEVLPSTNNFTYVSIG